MYYFKIEFKHLMPVLLLSGQDMESLIISKVLWTTTDPSSPEQILKANVIIM
jgi:hypothetical protein